MISVFILHNTIGECILNQFKEEEFQKTKHKFKRPFEKEVGKLSKSRKKIKKI